MIGSDHLSFKFVSIVPFNVSCERGYIPEYSTLLAVMVKVRMFPFMYLVTKAGSLDQSMTPAHLLGCEYSHHGDMREQYIDKITV